MFFLSNAAQSQQLDRSVYQTLHVCLLVRPVARNFVLGGLILIEIKINGGLRVWNTPPPPPNQAGDSGALPTRQF